MAKSKRTAIRPAESVPDSFDALQRRFLSLTSRLEALKDTLGNSENVPIELGAAAFVFRETADEMVELQGDIESWHSDHEHTPKAAKELQSMSNDMASTEASSDEQDDSFSPLMHRLESAIHRLKLAAEDLHDLAETMPAEEHGSAAFVVAETTEDLNRLYRDLDAWETTHDYTPKDMQPLIEHLREIQMEGSGDGDINRMLRGRTVVISPSWPPD